MALGLVLAEHPQDDARHRHNPREGGGGQQGDPARPALQRGQADDPPGDTGAQDGPHDDADGLLDLHHAGVDKAHHHHRGGRGGLDDGGDAGAQKHPLEGAAGELVEDQLQFVARHLLQPVPHEGHAEEEEGHAAEQRDEVGNAHSPHAPFVA